jgi:hypothetical protein
MPRDLILITSGMKAVLIVAMIHHVIYNKAHMLLIYANIPAPPLAPAWQTTPARAQAQEDKPRAIEARRLPDAAPWARHYRPLS